MKKILALICAFAIGLFSAPAKSENLLYLINVGKGDAILLFAGQDTYLVDCAKSDAWEAVEAALSDFGISRLKGVFLTHTDKDHSGGLKKLAKSDIVVDAWYASDCYACEEEDHPLVKAAKKADGAVTWLRAGDSVDGLFTVLGPTERDESEENNNSLVLRYEYAGIKILLTGDMEFAEEADLLKGGTDFSCDVFKVPNHGDDDVCLYTDLAALGAKFALISTDPYEKPGTPDSALLERLERAGMEILRTDHAEKGILLGLTDGEITAEVR